MRKKTAKDYWEAIDFQRPEVRRSIIWLCIGLLFLLSIYVRISLVKFQNPDYLAFSSWYDFIKIHGLHSFKYGYYDGFSNYNPPYTYFLYIVAQLPIHKIVAIKGILAVFDYALAASVYYVVKFFKPKGFAAAFATLLTLFLPTVLLTGVFWGQFDQLYVAGLLMSLGAILRGKSRWAWFWFGVAISIKFQAVFFLPVLCILVFYKIKWYDIWAGIVAFLVLTLPPLFVGRSLGALLNIYPAQEKLFNGNLTLNAPTIYQWFPNSVFPYFNNMGIGLAFAAMVGLLAVTLLYKKLSLSSRDILTLTSLVLCLVPFILPAMHERYFFPAGIASVVLAFIYPTRSFVGAAILMQIITIFSYCPFLFGTTPIPFSILSLGVLSVICIYAENYLPAAQLGFKNSTKVSK